MRQSQKPCQLKKSRKDGCWWKLWPLTTKTLCIFREYHLFLLLGIFNAVTTVIDNLAYWRGPEGTQLRKQQGGKRRASSMFEENVMTLMRIRLGVAIKLLAYLFGVHASTSSRVFKTWVSVLHGTLQHMLVIVILWPSLCRAVLQVTLKPEP